MDVICKICGIVFKVKPYRVNTAQFCSRKCKGRIDSVRLKGNTLAAGHKPWNDGIKGIHLSPQSEFKKGMRPWNKNVKGLHLNPATEFKKGRVSENKVPVGTTKIRIHKRNHKRRWIKIAEPNTWMLNSRFVYSQHEDLVEGMIIHHIDRDTLNDDITNLAQITRAEHLNEHRHEF